MTDQPKAELFVSSTRWHAGVATRERAEDASSSTSAASNQRLRRKVIT